jgi:hypothetical protein
MPSRPWMVCACAIPTAPKQKVTPKASAIFMYFPPLTS